MQKKLERRLMTALDLGSSKVTVLTAELSEAGELKIVAMGVAPCQGLKKGLLVQQEEAGSAIRKALESAERSLGEKIRDVVVSSAGEHIQSFNVEGAMATRGPIITALEVERVVLEAKNSKVSATAYLMHVLPQAFVIDHQTNIKEPVGLAGTHLKAYVHVVTGSPSLAQELIQCVEKQDLHVTDLVLSSLASGLAVLTNDEKELGVFLIDIGAGTTDVALFMNGALSFSASLPVGGDHVTQDIAHAFKVSLHEAELLKNHYGLAQKKLARPEESIDLKAAGNAPLQRLPIALLAEVIEARMAEILTLVFNRMIQAGLKEYISTGLVLTGGGCKIPGTLELAADIFHQPVRLGLPQYVTGVSDSIYDPSHSTGVGLLMYAKLQQEAPIGRTLELKQTRWKSLQDWLKKYF